jgi:hypothetical protein
MLFSLIENTPGDRAFFRQDSVKKLQIGAKADVRPPDARRSHASQQRKLGRRLRSRVWATTDY